MKDAECSKVLLQFQSLEHQRGGMEAFSLLVEILDFTLKVASFTLTTCMVEEGELLV